jgi:signal transduction histidine kinase
VADRAAKKSSVGGPGPACILMFSSSSSALRYGIALGAVAVAYALQRLIWPFIPPSPHLFFYPAVFIVARLVGARAGYVVTLAAAVTIAVAFLLPRGVLEIERARDELDLAVFVAVSLGISAAVGQLRETVLLERAAAVKAEEAKRSTDATWSMVAHDLRTPLNVINIGSAALGKRAALTPEMARTLAMIERSTVRASVLLDEALDAMRAAEGKLRIDPAECDPRELCAHAIDAVSLIAMRHGVRVESDVSVRHALLCDQPRIEQVLVNLLGNAIKFTPPRGVVSLYVDEEEDGMHFSVCDTGRGIPEAEIEAIFAKFWSGTGSGGSGLGLWIACAILETHAARLSVERRVGEGATFRFILPKARGVGLPEGNGGARAS